MLNFFSEILGESSKKYPEKSALSCQNGPVSYTELDRRVNLLHNGLKNIGITSNLRVGLALNNSVDFVVCLFAFTRNNNITCLLNTHLTPGELENKLNAAKIDVAVLEDRLYHKIRKSNPSFEQKFRIILRQGKNETPMAIDEIMKKAPASHQIEDTAHAAGEDILIQCSSGTTGLSKMAYRTHQNLSTDTGNIIATFNYSAADTIYCPSPLCHGYGLTMGLLAPLRCGATIHLERWFMANRFLKIYAQLKPTILIGLPDDYKNIRKHLGSSKFTFAYNKWFICSGSPLTEKVGIDFNKISGSWINQVYGMMETSTISANLNANKENFLSVGKPVRNVHVRINGESPPDNYGEILVKSGCLSRRYVDSRADEEITLINGWFKTNDRGTSDADKNIYLSGRMTD